MKSYSYQLVNVFAESHFGGNPLAVFTSADELNDEQMQLIARQFNLSETVFVQTAKAQSAVKKLRIFTPDYEMPFAGHPTLGSAFVLHNLLDLPDQYQLETQAGLVNIQHQQHNVRLALNNGVQTEPCQFSLAQCAELLNLAETDIVDATWVNTGAKQLLVQVSSAEAVKNCQISKTLFLQLLNKQAIYIWFQQDNQVKVRLFFDLNGAIVEDPGTGSAAANLGGWAISQNLHPLNWKISQGDEINRPNRLQLAVDENQIIYVSGNVIAVGQGEFFVPQAI